MFSEGYRTSKLQNKTMGFPMSRTILPTLGNALLAIKLISNFGNKLDPHQSQFFFSVLPIKFLNGQLNII